MNKSIVTFTRGTLAQATPLWQYDYGQVLEINGLELPTTYQVHFCNCSDTQTITVLGNADGVLIPDNLLQTGKTVIAYIYLHTGADDGETEYKITIPVRPRPAPSDIPPTPEQQSALDEAIAALNSAVDTVEDIADGIPDQINTALAEAKASGAFDGPPGPSGEDGNGVWWTTDAIAIRGSVYYTQERNVQGRAGATPQAEDLLVGPDPGTAGPVSYLYSVRGVENSLVYLDGIGSIKGETGPQGPSGEDGFSPTVTVTEIDGGHRVTITDEDGDHVFDVMDGEASIAKTVSGEILAFEDGVADKPTALSVEIPYQTGGISGFTMRFRRRNMLDLTGTLTSAGLSYTPQSDGTLEINGTATGNSRYGAFGSTSYANTNNTYNLPAGNYTVFARWTDADAFSAGWHVYVGTSKTKIGDFSSSGAAVINNAISQNGRVSCQFASGTSFDHKKTKLFMGVGTHTVEDFDAPSTTRYELEVDIGQTVYGGTANLSGGVFRSEYAADGTELAEPVEIPIEVELPTLFEGANTIWASVIGSTVTMTYGKTAKDYIDEKTAQLQTEIDVLDATTQGQLTGEFSSLGMFAKIGIIGDSYAQGSIHYPGGSGVYKPLSWGKHLERDLSIGVTLYTHGGYATRDWITDTTYGLPKLEADAVTDPCDLYWFGLGINDSAYYDDHPDYLGSITDISSHVSGDPWAATFYGNMGQIVERIQTAAPSSKIVIASFVADRPKAPRTWDTALNNALADVAEYFGLPFIDLRDDPFYMSDFYSDQCYGDHPTAIGYAGMAQANERLFARAAVEYRAYFMDYHNATAFPTGGGGGTSDYDDLTNKPQIAGVTLSGNKSLADLGIAAASDIPSVPAAATAAPADLGTAAVGSSSKYAREDHVHKKPTYSKSDVGLGNVDNVQQYSATNPPPYPVTSVNGSTGAVSLTIPSTAGDVGAIPAPASPSAGDVLTYSSGAWGASAPSHQIPSGGNAGECLAKKSSSDYDLKWRTINDWTPAGLMRTAGGTAAKVAEWSFWSATQYPAWLVVTVGNSNTYAGAITLKVNGSTAYPIYINGAASSATNYTLPAGSYFVYFDGSKFDFRTDGKLPGDIIGHADKDIQAPASPTTGDFLVWNGSAWAATTLAAWQGGAY